MRRYTFFYRGGKPENKKAVELRQPKWNDWLLSLGERLVDRGAPAKSLGIAGSTVKFAEVHLSTGYSVILAESDEEAMQIAETCPIYTEGGVVEVARYVEPTRLMASM